MPTRSVFLYGVISLGFTFVPLAHCEPPAAEIAKGLKAAPSLSVTTASDWSGSDLNHGISYTGSG